MDRRNFIRLSALGGLGVLLESSLMASDYDWKTNSHTPGKHPVKVNGPIIESICYKSEEIPGLIKQQIENMQKEAQRSKDRAFDAKFLGMLFGIASMGAADRGFARQAHGADLAKDIALTESGIQSGRANDIQVPGIYIDQVNEIDPYSVSVQVGKVNTLYWNKDHKANVGRGYIEILQGKLSPLWMAVARSIDLSLAHDKEKNVWNFANGVSGAGGPFKVGQKFSIIAHSNKKDFGLSMELYEGGKRVGKDLIQDPSGTGILYRDLSAKRPGDLTAIIKKDGQPFAKFYVPIRE